MPPVMKKEAMAREAKGMPQKITTKLPILEGDKPKKMAVPHLPKDAQSAGCARGSLP